MKTKVEKELKAARKRIEYIQFLLKYTFFLVKDALNIDEYAVTCRIPALDSNQITLNNYYKNDESELFAAVIQGKTFIRRIVDYTGGADSAKPTLITELVMTEAGDRLIEKLEEAYEQVAGLTRLKVEW